MILNWIEYRKCRIQISIIWRSFCRFRLSRNLDKSPLGSMIIRLTTLVCPVFHVFIEDLLFNIILSYTIYIGNIGNEGAGSKNCISVLYLVCPLFHVLGCFRWPDTCLMLTLTLTAWTLGVQISDIIFNDFICHHQCLL